MSIPPGRTNAPLASSSLRPRRSPPSWLILPSVMPRSQSAELPAVATVPPRITRSHHESGTGLTPRLPLWPSLLQVSIVTGGSDSRSAGVHGERRPGAEADPVAVVQFGRLAGGDLTAVDLRAVRRSAVEYRPGAVGGGHEGRVQMRDAGVGWRAGEVDLGLQPLWTGCAGRSASRSRTAGTGAQDSRLGNSIEAASRCPSATTSSKYSRSAVTTATHLIWLRGLVSLTGGDGLAAGRGGFGLRLGGRFRLGPGLRPGLGRGISGGRASGQLRGQPSSSRRSPGPRPARAPRPALARPAPAAGPGPARPAAARPAPGSGGIGNGALIGVGRAKSVRVPARDWAAPARASAPTDHRTGRRAGSSLAPAGCSPEANLAVIDGAILADRRRRDRRSGRWPGRTRRPPRCRRRRRSASLR